MSAHRATPSADDLVRYFAEGETPRAEWRIGLEHEKIGVLEESGARLPYGGERSIRTVLERLAAGEGWKPVYEGGALIALQKDGASITLEPGGQMELSGAPLATIREICAEFTEHVTHVKEVCSDLGIAWLGLGEDPFHAVAEIPEVPKERYAIMRSYLPGRGPMALDMMHATATVQANFDFADEADMVRKLRTATAISPVVSALFANSTVSEGRANGFASHRVEIWRFTDPDRCGVPDVFFSPDFGYRAYAEWALDVPMFFLVRDSRYLPADGATFRQFLRDGLHGHRATLEDWEVHLTTVFPEVRLKRYIEVRGADAVPPRLTCALPALWKGILYDDEALGEVAGWVDSWRPPELREALAAVARRGLAAELFGRTALEWARDLVGASAAGLRRIALRGETDRDERSFLEPVFEILERGESPGEEVRRRWQGEWKQSPQRLIEHARY